MNRNAKHLGAARLVARIGAVSRFPIPGQTLGQRLSALGAPLAIGIPKLAPGQPWPISRTKETPHGEEHTGNRT